MSEKKKKILIVNKSLDIGGIEIAMVNMANILCASYEIHIISFNPDGILKEKLDSRIKIISPCRSIQLLGIPFVKVLKEGTLCDKLLRILYVISSRLLDNRLCVKYANSQQKTLEGYDMAISFCHEQPKHSVTSGFCRFVDQCTDATIKIAWIHYDASSIDLSHSFNKKYYTKMDKIVAVSQSVMSAFGCACPELKPKLDYCYNFFDSKNIWEKSMERQLVSYPENGIICFSACRLSKEKGIPRAIKAFSKTFKTHKDLYWYIAGDGPEKEEILNLIERYELNKQIILIGSQGNPYPYIRNCNLYLSVSYHEAAPMVYIESKILHTPVFSTRVLSTDEMLKNEIEDFVCENNAMAMEKNFLELINNPKKIFDAKNSLKGYQCDNTESLEKINSWLLP